MIFARLVRSLAFVIPLFLVVAFLANGARMLNSGSALANSAEARTLNYQATVENVDGGQVDLPVMVYVPANAQAKQPLRVLVALHPYGGNGPAIGGPLVPFAEREGWVLVAPTFPYRDWRDPELVRKDAAQFIPGLHAILSGLEGRTGLALQQRVLLYGFSRGAQAAHRFALANPDLVAGVAAFSAGTYTLPKTTWKDSNGTVTNLNFPYGVSDIGKFCGHEFDLAKVKEVQFLIGVGANDHEAKDVPRNWDKYIGDCRLDRAESFATSLREAGVRVEEVKFANTRHSETEEMRVAGIEFLRRVAAEGD